MADEYVALIPAAGRGERLRPFTHTKPKPLVFVAGKPIIAHMLESLKGVVTQVVVVVGYMKDMLIRYLQEHYSSAFDLVFVEQERRLGLGHAVYLGLKQGGFDGKGCLITLGDEFFGMSYSEMLAIHKREGGRDGSLGIKEVDNPSQYGIVETKGGRIIRLIEKPSHARSNKAIAGVYFIDNTSSLMEALSEEMPSKDVELNPTPTKMEVQLTDALDRMVQRGAELGTFFVPVWYDCGRPDMLLKVNRVLLEGVGHTVNEGDVREAVILEPSYISPGCIIQRSVIGPHVSIAPNTIISDSIIRDSIIGSNTKLENVVMAQSIIGDNVSLVEKRAKMNIGEDTVISIGNGKYG